MVTTTPAWPNLPAVPEILSGRIRSVPLSPGNAGWRLDLDRLFDACDRRTRVIFLNSPNNPTGWMMSAEEQQAVLEFARARGLWIVGDEVYARIVYDRPVAPSFLEQALPDDRLIVVNSFSKSWAMTGWRLGWITAPAELAPTFEMLTEYNIAGPAGFIQRAGVVAVQDGEPFVRETVARYAAARELVIARLRRHPAAQPADPGRRLLRLLPGRRHDRQPGVRQGAARRDRRRPRARRRLRRGRRGPPSALLRRDPADPRARPRPLRRVHGKRLTKGGPYWDRMSHIAVWNTVMDEDRYMVRKWNEFIAA